MLTSDKDPKLFKEIQNHFLFKSTENFLTDKEDRYILFQIFHPEEFQKLLLKDKFKKTNYPVLKVDLIDFIYMLRNKKLINYTDS